MSTAAVRKPISEKKLAASRANARRSSGPRSAAGKAKVSSNACKHYLYPRTHLADPATLAAAAATACPDPADHPYAAELAFWATLLKAHRHFENGLYLWAAEANLGDERRGAGWLMLEHPALVAAVESRYLHLGRQFDRAFRA